MHRRFFTRRSKLKVYEFHASKVLDSLFTRSLYWFWSAAPKPKIFLAPSVGWLVFQIISFWTLTTMVLRWALGALTLCLLLWLFVIVCILCTDAETWVLTFNFCRWIQTASTLRCLTWRRSLSHLKAIVSVYLCWETKRGWRITTGTAVLWESLQIKCKRWAYISIHKQHHPSTQKLHYLNFQHPNILNTNSVAPIAKQRWQLMHQVRCSGKAGQWTFSQIYPRIRSLCFSLIPQQGWSNNHSSTLNLTCNSNMQFEQSIR